MTLKDNITPSVLQASVGLLQPYAPDLSPRSLVAALKAYGAAPAPAAPADGKPQKPLTRKEVADLLSCSLQTVNRYMNQGKLRRIVLTPKSVRICPDSVEKLLNGDTGKGDE
ncbi:MAG TPA: helix-turn-helix domain-containing protein [Lentisphaeria bacterium]|nr:helix-turn-helix domain-containing protein [Lentisphaeria bacterium]